MKRMYTVMESNVGETQTKINQAISVANEVPLLVTHKNDSTIHVTPTNKTAWNGAVTDIGTKANLLTTDKSNLVGAVNELFTNANNGKTAVASAVTAKGVTASPTDTFTVLATKIGQINTGKRFATGEFQAIRDVNVTGLAFQPSIVFLRQGNTSENPWTTKPYQMCIYHRDFGINLTAYRGYNDGSDFTNDSTLLTINGSGFSVRLMDLDSFSKPHKWIAIE